MSGNINAFFVWKNRSFRDIVLFNKAGILKFMLLSVISITIFSSFPLITQVYIRYIFEQESLQVLLWVSVLFVVMYVVKWFIDTYTDRFRVKYFAKLEKNIREMMYDKYQNKLRTLYENKSDLYAKHTHLFIRLVHVLLNEFLNVTKILIISIIIIFFDVYLFVYFLFSLPFFVLFYLLISHLNQKSKDFGSSEADFGNLLRKAETQTKKPRSYVMSHLESGMQKKIFNQQKYIPVRQGMDLFVSVFRLLYLAYFGYYIIFANFQVSGIIVGLLFITILMRPILQIIESQKFYVICRTSFFRIVGLLKK